MKPYAVVADLGGTKISAACVDAFGKMSHYRLAATPAKGGRAVLKALNDLFEQLPTENAGVLCVAVPGLAYPDGTVWAPNICGWDQMPLGQILSKRFRLPVLVESDRNAFVSGEAWRGMAKGCQDVVFVAAGTGIGAGIISGGRLVRGSHELSGCLGWMAVCDRLKPIYESVGCLEAYVAGPGIARAGRALLHREVRADEIVQMARRGNARARKILDEAGHYLGLAFANLVDVLNPEMIVLGGGVSKAGNLILRPAILTMKQWAQPIAVKQVRVVRSRLGSKAGLLGAAKLAFDRFIQPNRDH